MDNCLCVYKLVFAFALRFKCVYGTYSCIYDSLYCISVFAAKDGLSPAKVTMRIVALVLVGTFLVGSSLMFREICQQGFAVVTAKTYSLLDEITEKSSRIPMNSQSKMIPTIIKPLCRPTKGR